MRSLPPPISSSLPYSSRPHSWSRPAAAVSSKLLWVVGAAGFLVMLQACGSDTASGAPVCQTSRQYPVWHWLTLLTPERRAHRSATDGYPGSQAGGCGAPFSLNAWLKATRCPSASVSTSTPALHPLREGHNSHHAPWRAASAHAHRRSQRGAPPAGQCSLAPAPPVRRGGACEGRPGGRGTAPGRTSRLMLPPRSVAALLLICQCATCPSWARSYCRVQCLC